MDFYEITDELECWVDESVEYLQDNNEDLKIEELMEKFYIEKFEHAFIIRYDSKRGDFPRLANSYLLNEYFILQSGEIEDKLVIADTDAKIPFNIEQLSYKYLLEDLMKNCKKGYTNEIELSDGEKFKITVEKL